MIMKMLLKTIGVINAEDKERMLWSIVGKMSCIHFVDN